MNAPPRRVANATHSALANALEPLGAAAWLLFLVWTAIVAVLWAFDVRGAEVQARIAHPELQTALRWLLDAADPLWIVLAAANSYFWLVAAEGLGTARRWSLILLGGSGAALALLHWVGGPLSPVRYTARLGPMLGPIPCALPLLWFVVILGARALLQRILPRAGHWQIALGTGVLAAGTALNLEPLASGQRLWWTWRRSLGSAAPTFSPLASGVAWLILGTVLAGLLREQRVAPRAMQRLPRPLLALGLLHALLLAAHLGRALGI